MALFVYGCTTRPGASKLQPMATTYPRGKTVELCNEDLILEDRKRGKKEFIEFATLTLQGIAAEEEKQTGRMSLVLIYTRLDISVMQTNERYSYFVLEVERNVTASLFRGTHGAWPQEMLTKAVESIIQHLH